jgi:hypothetical protein
MVARATPGFCRIQALPTQIGLASVSDGVGGSKMPERWYCAWEKRKHGPFAHGGILDFWLSGKLRPADYILKEGAQHWIPVVEFPFLRELRSLHPPTCRKRDPERLTQFLLALSELYSQHHKQSIDHSELAARLTEWRQHARAEMHRLSDLPKNDPLNCAISLFAPMDYGRLETANTRALGWLFDPRQGHGFGTTLLKTFLASLHHEFGNAEFFVDKVECERMISHIGENASGRLDILATGRFAKHSGIDLPWVLLIEAKIDASEQPNQLERYEQWVDARHPDALFVRVFLTPDGRPAESGSGNWKAMSFLSLACALRRAYGMLSEENPGYHYLRFFITGVLSDICGWRLPLPRAHACLDPYGYLEYLRTVHETLEEKTDAHLG